MHTLMLRFLVLIAYQPYARAPNIYWNYTDAFTNQATTAGLNPVTYFHWKIITLARIWTLDLPGTKPICYQLSYPGLD